MHNLVVILMILVCFNFIIKQTWHKWWSVLAQAAVAGIFTGVIWPFAVRQSRSQIEVWLSDPQLMLDTAVVVSIEVILQLAFCLLSAHLMTLGRLKRSTVFGYRVLRWFPGVLIFAVLFSLTVFMIFSFPGVPFPAVSWGTGAAVSVIIAAGAWGFKKLFPDKETRLELFFLSNVITAIISVIATVNGQTAVAGVESVDYTALAGVLALVAIFALLGWKTGAGGRPFRIIMKIKIKDN